MEDDLKHISQMEDNLNILGRPQKNYSKQKQLKVKKGFGTALGNTVKKLLQGMDPFKKLELYKTVLLHLVPTLACSIIISNMP